MPRTAYKHGDSGAAWIKAVGQRLRWVREIVADSQTQAAELLGTDQSTYSQWENGKRLAPVHKMLEACALWGITLDYLYRGRLGGDMRRDVELRLVAHHPQLVTGEPEPAAEPVRPSKAKGRVS